MFYLFLGEHQVPIIINSWKLNKKMLNIWPRKIVNKKYKKLNVMNQIKVKIKNGEY